MKLISINCPACGGTYDGPMTSGLLTCDYCGTRFALDQEELGALGLDGQGGEDDGYEEYEFADMSMEEYAEGSCESFLEEVGYEDFERGRKIFRGLGLEDNEYVYLIHDDTVFKSGKNGFAITSEGFFCRPFGESDVTFVDWETFANNGEPYIEDSYVCSGHDNICYFTDGEEGLECLHDLCLSLYEHAWYLYGE